MDLDHIFDQDHENTALFEIYSYIKTLGNGAFGTVICARIKSTNEECAIKIINKNSIHNGVVDSLRNEARILSQLDHPNIVKFIDIIETEKKIFLIMECVKDGSLKSLIESRTRDNKPFTDEEASSIMNSIIHAVNYVHSKDIVHRDIKPENILLGDKNDFTKIKLGDFGLSVQYDKENNGKSFFDQCGTKLYMAPELFTKQKYSKPVDIWSCGIIMYMLLSNGRHPLYTINATPEEFMHNLFNANWTFNERFTPMAKKFFLKLVEKDPTDRLTAEQMLKHPWITRNFLDEIPLSLGERMNIFYREQALSRIIKAILFMTSLKRNQHLLRTVYGGSSISYTNESDIYDSNQTEALLSCASEKILMSEGRLNDNSIIIPNYKTQKSRSSFAFQLNPVEFTDFEIPKLKLEPTQNGEENLDKNRFKEMNNTEREFYTSSSNKPFIADKMPKSIQKNLSTVTGIANYAPGHTQSYMKYKQGMNHHHPNAIMLSSKIVSERFSPEKLTLMPNLVTTNGKFMNKQQQQQQQQQQYQNQQHYKPIFNILATRSMADKSEKNSPDSFRKQNHRNSHIGSDSFNTSTLYSPEPMSSPIKLPRNQDNPATAGGIGGAGAGTGVGTGVGGIISLMSASAQIDYYQSKPDKPIIYHTKNRSSTTSIHSITNTNTITQDTAYKLPHVKTHVSLEKDSQYVRPKPNLVHSHSHNENHFLIRRSINGNELDLMNSKKELFRAYKQGITKLCLTNKDIKGVLDLRVDKSQIVLDVQKGKRKAVLDL